MTGRPEKTSPERTRIEAEIAELERTRRRLEAGLSELAHDARRVGDRQERAGGADRVAQSRHAALESLLALNRKDLERIEETLTALRQRLEHL